MKQKHSQIEGSSFRDEYGIYSLLFDYIRNLVDITIEDEQCIMNLTEVIQVPKGNFLVRKGTVCDNAHFVVKGCLKTSYTDWNGKEHILQFSTETWWASDFVSFTERSIGEYDIRCLEDCMLIRFSHTDFEMLYRKIPVLERFFRLIVQRAFAASQKRILNNINLSGKEKYLLFCSQYPDMARRIPQYMIASYLGITPEFLSKIKSLKK